MIRSEALTFLSMAQMIITPSSGHIFLLSYHKEHNPTQESNHRHLASQVISISPKAAFWLKLYLEPIVFNFKKRNFVHTQESKNLLCYKQNVALKPWEVKAVYRTRCFFSAPSPTKHSSQPLFALGCFLNEQATSCKPTWEVRKTFSHFSCSCQIFKKISILQSASAENVL